MSAAIIPSPASAPSASAGSFRTRETEKRFFDLYLRDPTYCNHNIGIVFFLRMAADAQLVLNVMEEIRAKHAMLGARFEIVGEEWRLFTDVCLSVETPPAPCGHDASDEEWRAAISRAGGEQARRSHFPKLVHLAFFRRNQRECAVILTMNHSVTDLAGLVYLCNDVALKFDSLAAGRPAQLEPAQYSIGELAEDEFRYVSSARCRENIAWWQQRLAGHPPDPRLREPHGGSATLTGELSENAIARIQARAADAGATASILLLARYVQALHRVTSRSDLLVNSITARRGLVPGDHALVGCLLDYLIFRLENVDYSVTEDVARALVRHTVTSTHRWVPYGLLIRALAPSHYHTNCGFVENEYNFIPSKSMQLSARENVEVMPVQTQRGWLTFRRGVVVMARGTRWPLYVTVDPAFVSEAEARELATTMTDW